MLFFLCIAELDDVDLDELRDKSNEWMNVIDIGGLKHVTDMIFTMFTRAKVVVCRQLDTTPSHMVNFS